MSSSLLDPRVKIPTGDENPTYWELEEKEKEEEVRGERVGRRIRRGEHREVGK